jgi:DNA-directed RNA polymerase beta subunit
VPLLEPESPIVGTGMEERAARDSGQVLVAKRDGVVIQRDRRAHPDRADSGELDEYKLQKFVRSNQGTCINQRPIVDVAPGSRPARRSPTAPRRASASSPSAGTSSWRS